MGRSFLQNLCWWLLAFLDSGLHQCSLCLRLHMCISEHQVDFILRSLPDFLSKAPAAQSGHVLRQNINLGEILSKLLHLGCERMAFVNPGPWSYRKEGRFLPDRRWTWSPLGSGPSFRPPTSSCWLSFEKPMEWPEVLDPDVLRYQHLYKRLLSVTVSLQNGQG